MNKKAFKSISTLIKGKTPEERRFIADLYSILSDMATEEFSERDLALIEKYRTPKESNAEKNN